MSKLTSIQIEQPTLDKLKTIKEYPRQTYNELINKMIEIYVSEKNNNQYDNFLHKIQQLKMKELWDNKNDEIWDERLEQGT